MISIRGSLYRQLRRLTAVLFLLLPPAAASVHAEDMTLTLGAGLRMVADKSRAIGISRAEERIAAAESDAARSHLLPSVNVSAGWTALTHQPAGLFGPKPVPLSERNFLAYSLSVQQLLFDFRAAAARYDASRAMASARKHETDRVRNLAAIEFVLAYLDLLEEEKITDLAGSEVDSLDAHRKMAAAFFEEGVVTRNELLQAEVKIADARQRLLTARTARKLQASRINTLLQRPLSEAVAVRDIDDLTAAPAATFAVERASELARLRRPELKMVDETLTAFGFTMESLKAENFPKLFIRGGYDYTENRYQLHEGNGVVALGLTLNLFSGGLTAAELRKNEIQAGRLRLQREQLLDQILLEVEQAQLQAVTARERLQVTKDAAGQAEENLAINRVRFEEGIGTGTDVLDAVALRSAARTNYYRALYDLRKAEAALFYAAGQDLLEVYQ